ncbi:hypothetical protein DV736_g3516, partial [Chaetothyriales sp. CBS 134916]
MSPTTVPSSSTSAMASQNPSQGSAFSTGAAVALGTAVGILTSIVSFLSVCLFQRYRRRRESEQRRAQQPFAAFNTTGLASSWFGSARQCRLLSLHEPPPVAAAPVPWPRNGQLSQKGWRSFFQSVRKAPPPAFKMQRSHARRISAASAIIEAPPAPKFKSDQTYHSFQHIIFNIKTRVWGGGKVDARAKRAKDAKAGHISNSISSYLVVGRLRVLWTMVGMRLFGERLKQAFHGADPRVCLAFWLLGLINNVLYVIILSAALDLVGPSVPKGVVLLADVVPSFITKLLAPYLIHVVPYPARVVVFVFLSAMGMLLISLTPDHANDATVAIKMVGVMLASLSSGGGELTFLGLVHYYGPFSLAAWGSGTGGAGLIGAGAYALATTTLGFSVERTLLASAGLPVVMLVSFFVILPLGPLQPRSRPRGTIGRGVDGDDNEADREETEGLLADDIVPKATFKAGPQHPFGLEFRRNLGRAKALFWPFMFPLLLVYIAEYTINQGVAPTLLFPLKDSPFKHFRAFYPSYNAIYQAGVFISRSSTPFFRTHNLYLPSLLQIGNLVLLTAQALFNFVPSVYIVFVVIFWEGLLGGLVYVNTFAEISDTVPSQAREFSLSATSVSDSGGICIAGFISMAFELWLFAPPPPLALLPVEHLTSLNLRLHPHPHHLAMAQHGHSPPLPRFGALGSPSRALNVGYADAHAQYPIMSISSMLGSEPERTQQPQPQPPPHPPDSLYSRPSPRPHSTVGASMPLGAAISPLYASRPAPSDYRLGTRSPTPDRIGDHLATRPYRSSSGSLMQRPATASSSVYSHNDEAAERARRTSLGGILHRPDSEPAMSSSTTPLPAHLSSIRRPESAAVAAEATASAPPSFGSPKAAPSVEAAARATGSYDTRPPVMSSTVRQVANPTAQHRDSSSRSPELRRSLLNGPEPRSLASLLSIGPERMQRQDSAQSQSSLFGDRLKSRQFSPFAGSVASQAMSTVSAPPDGLARKGSDELSQHRAVLGLAHDSKRGRYSPVPQAVKGAQAQTPVPDAGIKSEHGRVFAGLGGGLGSTSSAPPTSVPVGLSASPFKLGEATRLSEENLMKISRSSSGISKRPRKYDQDIRPESEVGDGKRGPRKKTKYGHSYRVDLENDRAGRSAPLAGLNGFGRAATPSGANSSQNPNAGHRLQHHGPSDPAPLLLPKKTIRVSSIITAAKRFPRRHLGNYIYNPEVSKSDCLKPGFDKFDVSIKPNLLPSFTEADQVNCTYTVRVSRIWLQARERSLICKEAYLWGSGVYTDDSDVVAAAMHSGHISSQPPDNVDKVLLDRVVRLQNAQIDGLVDLPDRPVEPAAGTDAVITLLVLPALERYPASSRFGLSSREWPGCGAKTPHDGVSFAILKVDFVTGGVEGLMLDQARKRLKEQGKPVSKKPHPLSVAHNASNLSEKDSNSNSNSALKDVAALDVGHTPSDWLRQADGGGKDD